MVVLVVVPAEERPTVDAPVLDTAEAVGEIRPVLEGLELTLRERVVVAPEGDYGSW